MSIRVVKNREIEADFWLESPFVVFLKLAKSSGESNGWRKQLVAEAEKRQAREKVE